MANTKSNSYVTNACLVWEPARFKEALERQIASGKELLKVEIPSSTDFDIYSHKAVRAYDKSQMNEFEKKMSKWKSYAKEILKAAFNNMITPYYREFEKADPGDFITIPEDVLAVYMDEIDAEIGVLESIIERLDLIPCATTKENKTVVKTKKVFISHSHDDGEFAIALVDLLHDIGFGYEEIFCSSVPACAIPEGKTIFDEIRAQFEKHDLFVIFIHSPRFYASHISMNEMGAAWVLRTDYSSFLTKDMTTDLMKEAVVRDDRIYIQIGDKQAQYRLNEWHERILKFFDKPTVKLNAWMQDSAKFLEKVENLTYPEVLPNVPMSNDEILSEEDKKILKQWADSDNIEMYKAEYIGGGCIILGDTDYPYTTAREEAKWNAFFKRLLKFGMIESTGREGNSARYLLTEKAYEYFEK